MPRRPAYAAYTSSGFQHHWTPPKGHLDQLSSGEWEEELVAALRETEEEAGIGKNHLQGCITATTEKGTFSLWVHPEHLRYMRISKGN